MALTVVDMMKGWVEDLAGKNRVLEEENKSLKLRIVTLTQELEMERLSNRRNSVNVETQMEEVSQSPGPRRKVQSQSDMNMNNGQQFPRVPTDTVNASQRGETLEKNGMSCSFMSISSEGDDSPFDELPLKEEPVDEYVTDNPQAETPSMDEDINIDIKEEDVDFLQPKSKSDGVNSIHDPRLLSSVNGDNPSQMPVDDSVPTVLLPASQTQSLCEQKKKMVPPYLRTRTAEKITCKRCSLSFNNKLQLMEHNNKYRKGGKCIPVNLKLKCSVCEKSFATTRVLALHKRSHNGEKPSKSLKVDDKGKKRLSVEKAKPRGQGRLKKKRKVETTAKLCGGEDLRVDETNLLDLNFNQLKSLSVDTMINPQNILDKILASTEPPVLRELSLRYDISRNTEDNSVVHNILKSVAPTLKSLIFRESLSSRNSGNPRTMRFPVLPHLEHLGLEYDIGYKYWIIPEAINLNADTFPSLKSIELPIGLYFTPSPVQSEENQINSIETKFPNLTQLTLRISSTTLGLGSLKRALKHLHAIFPTLARLSFSFDNVGGIDCDKHLMDLIMKSNLYKIKSIEDNLMNVVKLDLSASK